MPLPPDPTPTELVALFLEAMTTKGAEGRAIRGKLCDLHGSLMSQAMRTAVLTLGAGGYSDPATGTIEYRRWDPDYTPYLVPVEV